MNLALKSKAMKKYILLAVIVSISVASCWFISTDATTVDIEYDITYEQYASYRYAGIPSNNLNAPHFITPDDPTIQDIARQFNNLSLSDSATAESVLEWVQDNISYVSDIKSKGKAECYQFPIETLYLKTGDCEDSTFLYMSIMRALGYDVVTLYTDGHVCVGVNMDGLIGHYELINGTRYYVAEPTGTLKIGSTPANNPDLAMDKLIAIVSILAIVLALLVTLSILVYIRDDM